MDTRPVILAVASPPGFSLRGIVRISGECTFDLLETHMDVRSSRGCVRTVLNVLASPLPALALVFPGPHSYTGENAVELQVPGNPLLLERIIDQLLASARSRGIEARRAEPGEFTARAFFTGRISLTQAEGVAATIAARSDAELRAARFLRSGALGEFAHALVEDLAAALALVEAGIDFTDQEDVVPIEPATLLGRMRDLRERITDHLEHAVGMEELQAIPWVVLTGPPNAGKSTLFNALLGHERAVVSSIPGTTRDVLSEPLAIETDHGGAEVMLVDLAGADERDSDLNRHMQEAASEAIGRAELQLYCTDVDDPGEETPAGACVRTKADLHPSTIDIGRVGCAVSARSGEGMNTLRRLIAERLADRAVSLAADATVLRPRHEAALRAADRALSDAVAVVEQNESQHTLAGPELIASAMRAALDELSLLAGRVSPDDVLGRIFATFCVGK